MPTDEPLREKKKIPLRSCGWSRQGRMKGDPYDIKGQSAEPLRFLRGAKKKRLARSHCVREDPKCNAM